MYIQISFWEIGRFLRLLDSTLKSLHKSKTEFVICGDINVNYITDNHWKEQLSLLLSTSNLVYTVDFPTRINRNLGTAIDNIFTDNSRLNSFQIASIVNGLSDHDAQYHTKKCVYKVQHYSCEIQNKIDK
jgi:endonuclease/exonuclease/phosphatase family metal-dependent hydrolase